MRKVFTMNVIRKVCLGLGLALIFFAPLACENPSNPFKAGLGKIVDIRPPTIELLVPEVDTFIRGEVTFIGLAEDDYKVDRVEIKITNFPDLAANPWSEWTRVKTKAYNSLSDDDKELLDQKAKKLRFKNLKDMLEKRGHRLDDVWSATIDTVGLDPLSPIFPDGDFKIRLRAVDSVGKWAGDEDILFQLKNKPPIVTLTLPSITEGNKEGEAGSVKLNYGWAGNFPGGAAFPSVRILDTGAVLTGTIRDKEGVVFEKAAATEDAGEKRPPQFRFWRVNPNPDNPNDPGGFRPGHYPTATEVLWDEFVYEGAATSDSNIMEIGANEYLFMYKIPTESDRYYGFEIRVQSKDGTEFHYPRDFLPPAWWASSAVSRETKDENQYVLFYARLPQEYPTLDLYQLQNIFGENSWNGNAMPPRYEDIPGIDVNAYHPYVNSTAVFKNGSFILRVKASHSRIVDEARVFWERSDKTAKGLFIWDPADKDPPSYPSWNPNYSKPTTRPYEDWGYRDPHQNDTRNFIFTYHDDPAVGKDTLPVDGIESFAAGRYKVQTYVGSEIDWKNDREPSSWRDYTNPQGGKGLEEGSYDISGETVYGSSLISKYLCTITLDAEGPEITLNGIEGSPPKAEDTDVYTVNGVVRPAFRIFDSRARDSGLRSAVSEYYKRDNDRLGEELRYMLIRANDKEKMDTYLNQSRWNGNPWPQVPNVAPGTPYETIYKDIREKPYADADAGITIYKNGPILDGFCMFKATKIFDAGTSEDVLADGDYRLYAFARDNAFNVSWESYPILVDAASDIPGLEFIPEGAIAEEVIDPSFSADYPNSEGGKGFVVDDGSTQTVTKTKTRNKFGTNTTLRMRFSDDDSVNLGDERTEPPGNSGITVTITGTSSDIDGNVTAYAGDDYEMQLTEDDIFSVFRGQQLDGETRRSVRERSGTINQYMLLERIKGTHLPPTHQIIQNPLHPYNRLFGTVAGETPPQIKAKKDAYQSSSLPEGIYRITVTVQDYRPAKLRLPWESDPIFASKTKTIWIAVDSTGPSIDRESILPKEGSFLAANEQSIKITGRVSDKNGPITVKSFTSSPNLNLRPQDIKFTPVSGMDGVWEFEAPVSLGGNTGAFTFTFEFQDRFGNTNPPFSIKYAADDEPPMIGLFSMIRTFERDESDVYLHDPLGTKGQLPVVSTDSENKLRLTNGVVSFEISASDNSGKVEGIRWWLLPANRGSIRTGLDYTGVVTDFNAYPFSPTPPAEKDKVYYLNGPGEAGAYGEADVENRPYRFYIDTEKLHNRLDSDGRGGDGEYRLHVIGIDAPGNVSRNIDGTCILQEIYVLQEQDKPYFFEFAPASAEDVVDSLVVTGTIYEDHGFVDNNNNLLAGSVTPPSVRIWFSARSDTPMGLTDDATIAGYYTPSGKAVTVPDISLMGRNIGVKLNLGDYFTTIANGVQYYIIEATDSHYTKIKDDGTAADADSRRSRRQQYSFAYDSRDPVIVLNYPETGTSFGLNAGDDFSLRGYIEDAYLTKSANDNYYIKYRLDDEQTISIWEFTNTTGLGAVGPSINPVNGTRVNFNIPADRVTGAVTPALFDFEKLSPGSHTLTLIVEDKTGKDASVLLSFIKDTDAPNFNFTNIYKKLDVSPQQLPQSITNWWSRPNAVSETAWYNNKRTWLAANSDSEEIIIYYDSGVPVLTGTFTDDTSDIDIDSFKYYFDDAGAVATNWDNALKFSAVEGSGRNVRWSVYLTTNGKPEGIPIPILRDGIHTIRLTVADTCGNVMYPNPSIAPYFAFRIVSSTLPVAEITTGAPGAPDVTGNGYTVFGNTSGFTGTNVFTVYGTAKSPNLKDLSLKIVETANRNIVVLPEKNLVALGTSEPAAGLSWQYDTADGPNPPLNPPRSATLTWTYNITKTLYDTLTNGVSYDVIAVAVSHRTEAVSEEAVWTFTKDITKPEITFAGGLRTSTGELNNPTQIITTGATANANLLTSQTLRIQGGVTDSISRISALECKVWKYEYTTSTTGVWNVLTPPTTNQGWAVMPGFAANTSADINWTIDLSAAATALLNLDEGLYRIKVQAKDSSYINNPADPARVTASGDFITGDRGMGNPVTSDYMYFFYDRFGPTGLDPKVDGFYSSRPDGKITFKGVVTDPPTVLKDQNGIKNVTIEVDPEGVPANVLALMTVEKLWTPADGDTWELTLNVPFDGRVPDGRYRLNFIATDMAGNTTIVPRAFTLDNTPPVVIVNIPDKRPTVPGIPDYASDIVPGGQDAEITGTTTDKSDSRAESGVEAIWYHLGYINPSTMAAPTNAATYTTFFNANRVWESVIGNADRNTDSGNKKKADERSDNDRFDKAAKEDGNAWFKYEKTYKNTAVPPTPPDLPWPVPEGFNIGSINIYDWRMAIPHMYNDVERGGLKQYANPITVKGVTYNNSGGLRMVVPVPVSLTGGQEGIVSLPLWLRVVDKAGNVTYSCRDIWINPDADIPITSILNPQNADSDHARGGSISADGVATNNSSIYSVIYRVKAGNNQTPVGDPNGPSVNAEIIRFSNGATEILSGNFDTPEYGLIPPNYQSANGWYRANLEVARGEPIAPWNFLINSNNEITDKIGSLGFASGSATPNMIRVYMEVFVFNGSISPGRSSINQGANPPGTVDNPKPYVRTFYLKEGAPNIGDVMISTVGNSSTYRDASGNIQNATQYTDGNPSTTYYYEPYRAGLDPRRGRFHIRATLNAAPGQTLNNISVRRQNESDSGYHAAWQDGYTVMVGSNKALPGVLITPDGRTERTHTIRYTLDSTVTAGTNDYGAVRNGEWARSGGRYGVEIRIRDNSSPPGEVSSLLEVGIDNFAPVAAGPETGYISSKKAAGTEVDFLGRVFDYQGSPNANDGMPKKIESVYVWFTKQVQGQTRYVNFNDGSTQVQTGNSGTRNDIFSGRTATVARNGDTVTGVTINGNGGTTGTAVTFPGAGTGTGATFNVNGGWVKLLSESTAVPGSKMTWIPTNAWDIQWIFQTDTTILPDGEITLNYVVFDSAGNATFDQQTGIFIRNNYPEINKVTLSTNNYGVGAVFTSDAEVEFDLRDSNGNPDYDNEGVGYLNSGFISKNQTIGFRVETLFGNPQLSYRLQYVTRQEVTLNAATLAQMVTDRANPTNRINLYTIASHGNYSTNSWATLGVNISNPPVGTHFVFAPTSAAGLPEGTATVWRYTPVITRTPPAGQPGSANGNNNPVLPDAHNFNFNGATHFDPNTDQNTTNPTRIGEFNGSHPEGDESAPNDPADTAFFLIKVWDSVAGAAAPENDQLFDAVVIGMNVYLNDRERPTSRLYDLNPYTEAAVTENNNGTANQQTTRNNAMNPRGIGENIRRGGLYNTGTARNIAKSGHIEPRNGTTALRPQIKNAATGSYEPFSADGYWSGDTSLPAAIAHVADSPNNPSFTRDQVSGKVILRGVAWDNQLVREIRIRIGTEADTADRAILRLDINGDRTMKPVNSAQAVAREEMHWKTGHTVEWAYIWDTETRPNANGAPATNQTVTVTVLDQLSAGNLTSQTFTVTQENIATETFHNQVNVDIVPYVTGFERASRFATKRSRQGWYSFYQGETGIRAVGFNLVGTGNMTLTDGTTNFPLTVTAQDKNSVTFNIPAAARSGRISLTFGGTQVLNHQTGHTTQSWNREYHQFTAGSDLWLNKPYAHIWRSTQSNDTPQTYFGNSVAPESPSMALEYTGGDSGRLTGVWTVFENDAYFHGNNINNNRNTIWAGQGEPFVGTDVSLYNGATANGSTVATLQNDGRPVLLLARGGFPARVDNGGTLPTSTLTTHYAASPLLGNINNNPPRPTNRWRNNRVSRSANETHITSYDSYNRNLYYTRGSNNEVTTGSPQNTNAEIANVPAVVIDGNGAQVTGGIAASTNAGMYSAIDYDSTGPVIAYYDSANDTIRLAHANSYTPEAGNWTRRNLLPDTHPLFRGSGTYVSIKVDRTNNIHLAFYNSVHKTVVYAVGSRAGSFNFTACTVDNVVEGGALTDISVDNNGNPTIVYSDSSRLGNYDGMRLAYKSSQFTASLRDSVIGTDPAHSTRRADITGWEALTVPADYQVADDRLNVEVWPPSVRGGTLGNAPGGNWNAAVGYASRTVGNNQSMFRLAYFYQPASGL